MHDSSFATKLCPRCNTDKMVQFFQRDAAMKDGRKKVCAVCLAGPQRERVRMRYTRSFIPFNYHPSNVAMAACATALLEEREVLWQEKLKEADPVANPNGEWQEWGGWRDSMK